MFCSHEELRRGMQRTDYLMIVNLVTNVANITGGWSKEGCTSWSTGDEGFIDCECNHLTNFALILDTSQTGTNRKALQVVTWIGCGLSLVGLALTVATFLLFR